LIPPLDWASQQSFDSITIYNPTPYDWIRDKDKSHSYQINNWNECFPDMIPAGNIVVCPVIATIGSSFSTQENTDDAGDHYYIVKNGRDSRIHLHYQYPGKFTVSYENQPTLTVAKTQVTSTFTDNFFFLYGSYGYYMAFSDTSILHDSIGKSMYIKSTILDNFVLDAVSGQVGTHVQLSRLNNSRGQQWFLTDAGYVQSALKAADGSDLVLDVINGNTAVGAKLQIWYKNGSNAQRWTLNEGILKSNLNGYVLDIPNAKVESGVLVQLWSANGTAAQKWSIEEI